MTGEKVVGHKGWKFQEYAISYLRWSKKFEQYMPNVKLGNVLDFGCGIGRWIPLLTKYFDHYYGVDIEQRAINRASMIFSEVPGGNFQLIKDEYIPIPNIKFDIIWTCVTLQHIVDDKLLLNYARQFVSRLNPYGTIFCTENISENSSNEYISFRNIRYYEILFENFGLKLANHEIFSESGELHAIMIFR